MTPTILEAQYARRPNNNASIQSIHTYTALIYLVDSQGNQNPHETSERGGAANNYSKRRGFMLSSMHEGKYLIQILTCLVILKTHREAQQNQRRNYPSQLVHYFGGRDITIKT